MLYYLDFMRIAFLVGILLSISISLIGSVLVFKRYSMIGHSLSHTALGGVAIGLIAGFHPLYGAILFSILATLLIEFIRKKMPKYGDLAIAIVTSFGIGLTGVLTPFVSANNINAYMFGSILTISNLEVWITVIIFVITLLFFFLFYKELMFISFNEKSAAISGVPVNKINFVFSILTSIVVALASKTIGALIVSSILVIPTASAMQVAKSYKTTLWIAVCYSFASLVSGLTLSYYLKPGAAISLVSIALLVITILIKEIYTRMVKHHKHHDEMPVLKDLI